MDKSGDGSDVKLLHVAVEIFDAHAYVVGGLIHKVEPLTVVIVLGYQLKLAVPEGARDVVLVRVVEPERLDNVWSGLVACRRWDIEALQRDATNASMLQTCSLTRVTMPTQSDLLTSCPFSIRFE